LVEGRWHMKFRTTSNQGFKAPKVGHRYSRTWIFERRCREGRCRAVVRRETRSGFLTLRVRRSGSVYRVRWKTRAPCEDGQRTFLYRETITFTVTAARTIGGRPLASRIAGRVLGRAPKGSCQLTPGRATDRLIGRRNDLPSPPSAAFSIVPADLTAGATGYFTDESSDDGEVVSQIWDFGDPASGAANTASGPYPSHSFAAAGTYRVTLTVTDDDGLSDATSELITVSP
jgi:hypothetical protein